MGENDKKENKKKIISIIISLVITIIILIVVFRIFYNIPNYVYKSNQYLELGEHKDLIDWTSYYGAALGAILGGVITGGGLFISFRINARELKKQREIDDMKFNKQMKIQIINEKINDYKICIELINEFVDINDILYKKIEEYWENLSSFSNVLNTINDTSDTLNPSNFKRNFEIIHKQGESSDNVFNLDDINEYFLRSSNKLQEINVYSKCVTQENIINKIEEYSGIFVESYNNYKFIIDFNYENGFTKKYSDYFENEKELYVIFPQKKREMLGNITQYYKIINHTKSDFMSIKPLITDEIGKLYEEKYNLDKDNNEQKLSNNI